MTLMALSLSLAIAGAFLLTSVQMDSSEQYSTLFLTFFIPLPEMLVDTLEEASRTGFRRSSQLVVSHDRDSVSA